MPYRPSARLLPLLCAALLSQTPCVSCEPAPVAEATRKDQAEHVRLLAKWKMPEEGGPANREEARANMEKRFPAIAGWRSFSHIPDVVVIEINPDSAKDTAVMKRLPEELLQMGFFHYVEPDATFEALPER